MKKCIRPFDADMALLDTIVKKHMLTDIEAEAQLIALLTQRKTWARILQCAMKMRQDHGDELAFHIGKIFEAKIGQALRVILSEDETAHRIAKEVFYYLVAYRLFIYGVVEENALYEQDTSWEAVITYLKRGMFVKQFPEIPEAVVRGIQWLANKSKKTYQNNRQVALSCLCRAITFDQLRRPQVDVSQYMEQTNVL